MMVDEVSEMILKMALKPMAANRTACARADEPRLATIALQGVSSSNLASYLYMSPRTPHKPLPQSRL